MHGRKWPIIPAAAYPRLNAISEKCSTLSPREWLIQRRLEAARELIRKGGRKVSEICFEVGFKNLSHFSKAYKATYGIPPTEDIQQEVSLT